LSGSNGLYIVNDGSGDLTAFMGLYAFNLIVDHSYDITGILTDYYSTASSTHTYEILPRSANDIVDVTTGINENWNSTLTAYPNPFTNEIRFDGTQDVKRVIVTSITGQVLRNVEIGQVNFVNTQDLPQGIYLVTFMNDKGEKAVHKMIKE